MKLVFSRQIFEKYSYIKPHESRCTENRVVPCEQTDRHDEANSSFSQFLERALKVWQHFSVLCSPISERAFSERFCPYCNSDWYGALLEWYWQGNAEVLGEEPVLLPLLPLQILTSDPDMISNPGLCGEWPETERLSHGLKTKVSLNYVWGLSPYRAEDIPTPF